MKTSKEKTTYELRLLCRNYNEDWIENGKKGIYVRYRKDNNYMIKRGNDYENRMLFTRPKCRLNNKIARLPLKKELKK